MRLRERLRRFLTGDRRRTRELAQQQAELRADVAMTRREIEVQRRYWRMQQQRGGEQ